MATVADVIGDWTSEGGARHTLYGRVPGLVVGWINRAQLRFVHKSLCLRSVWEPTLDSDGYAVLPDNFIGVVKDRVKWDIHTTLVEANYSDLLQTDWSSTTHYCVHDGKFYVFAPSAGSPQIPYYRKPDEITIANRNSAYLEIPTEYHQDLLTFMDGMFQRHEGDIAGYSALMAEFDRKAIEAGVRIQNRTDQVPVMRGGAF
jgi:hypothetical protein